MEKDLIRLYILTLSVLLLAFLIPRCYIYTSRYRRWIYRYLQRYLVHKKILRRHTLLGPWAILPILLTLLFMGFNVLSLFLGPSTLSRRSGWLALTNLTILYASANMSYTADCLGWSLKYVLILHRCLGWVSSGLIATHVITIRLSTGPLEFKGLSDYIIFIGGCLVWLVCLFSYITRRLVWYELFLHTHKVLSVVIYTSIGYHLVTIPRFPRPYIYSIGISLLLLYISQLCHILYQNRRRGSTFTRAQIYPVDEGEVISRGIAVRVRVILSRPIHVEAGQYVGLWIPRVRLFESHPFVITSWSETKQSSLELFIQPKSGFTMRLLRYRQQLPIPRLAIITGPHGRVPAVLDYESVILFASDYGITAHLPYLKKLVHGYNYRKGQTRRIRLVWLISSLNLVVATQHLLNPILSDDTWNNVDYRSLYISIYNESSDRTLGALSIAFWKRAVLLTESPDIQAIIIEEASEIFTQSLNLAKASYKPDPLYNLMTTDHTELQENRGDMLILSSVTAPLRDHIRGIISQFQHQEIDKLYNDRIVSEGSLKRYLRDNIWLEELEYQPE